ncbi:MAG: arginase [Pseudomonadota bacterium]
MTSRTCILVGAGLDCGKDAKGCLMGPDAYRTAGLADVLRDLGHSVSDRGNVQPEAVTPKPDPKCVAVQETIAWTKALSAASIAACEAGLPIFLGGDHAISLGTVLGASRHAKRVNKPLFVLWLDAHSDYHTLSTTQSGNLHGTPVAYVTARAGFEGFPIVDAPVAEDHVTMIGLRSVDPLERAGLESSAITCIDMRQIDEGGISRPLGTFLDRVARENGMLHVSLDVDFLDPSIAPGVGTTVPGGATVREAHLVMEMIHDSGLMTSLDLVELNPFFDERGRTAQLMVDLAASAFGRRVFDRKTSAY